MQIMWSRERDDCRSDRFRLQAVTASQIAPHVLKRPPSAYAMRDITLSYPKFKYWCHLPGRLSNRNGTILDAKEL